MSLSKIGLGRRIAAVLLALAVLCGASTWSASASLLSTAEADRPDHHAKSGCTFPLCHIVDGRIWDRKIGSAENGTVLKREVEGGDLPFSSSSLHPFTGLKSTFAPLATLHAPLQPPTDSIRIGEHVLPPFSRGETVAEVNGRAISTEFFDRSFLRHLQTTGAPDDSTTRRMHLEHLVEQVLLAQAARERGHDDDAYERFVEVRQRQQLGALYTYVHAYDTLAALTEADVQRAYARTHERRAVRQLHFLARADAERYHARLEAGEDFLALAAERYGTAPGDSAAGWLGPLSYFDVDDAFAEAVWAVGVGEHTAPVRTRQGWVIARVEHAYRNPLLTQHGYERARGKTRALLQQRRTTLAGDAFVRQTMQRLDVQTDSEALRGLHEHLVAFAQRYPSAEAQPVQLSHAEAAPLRRTLSPETVLATYRAHGSDASERAAFTAEDYAAWLPLLPFGEALSRTGPSVGRALRHHVFAERALAEGLDADPSLGFAEDYLGTFYLAGRMLEALESASAEPLPDSVRARLEGLVPPQRTTADFWTVRAADLTEARWIRDMIASGQQTPEQQVRYVAYQGAVIQGASSQGSSAQGGGEAAAGLAPAHLAPHVRRAPLGTPVLLDTGDDWYVMQVDARRAAPVPAAERAQQLRDLEARYHLLRFVQQLRERAHVVVHRDAFHATMRHYADVARRP
jgi:hypothetical protein